MFVLNKIELVKRKKEMNPVLLILGFGDDGDDLSEGVLWENDLTIDKSSARLV